MGKSLVQGIRINAMAPHVLELTLKSQSELLDGMAPSCFGGQILRHEIADYFLEQIAAIPRKKPIKLILYFPEAEFVQADHIARVIKEYFESCRSIEQRRLHRVLRDGRVALLMGLVVLFIANGLAEGIRATSLRRLPIELANGLEIFGWVALWRPAELLLYEWIPVRSKKNQLARLAAMEVACHPIKL
jgi:hypothetical protein